MSFLPIAGPSGVKLLFSVALSFPRTLESRRPRRSRVSTFRLRRRARLAPPHRGPLDTRVRGYDRLILSGFLLLRPVREYLHGRRIDAVDVAPERLDDGLGIARAQRFVDRDVVAVALFDRARL